MPSFFSGLPTWKPGVSVGTMKADRPRLPSSGSVMAKTIATAARDAFEMNCLLPSSTQRPSLSTARVRRLLASEPACGSVRQNEPIMRPEASPRSQRSRCASVP